MLYFWHGIAINKGISVGDLILIEKAKEFGEMLGIVEGSSFNYSTGWLEKFKKRYNLKQFTIVGESGSVSKETIEKSLVMPNVKEAIYMIKEAWDKVSRETIVNCWRHAGNIL
jgi:hypothetical protein